MHFILICYIFALKFNVGIFVVSCMLDEWIKVTPTKMMMINFVGLLWPILVHCKIWHHLRNIDDPRVVRLQINNCTYNLFILCVNNLNNSHIITPNYHLSFQKCVARTATNLHDTGFLIVASMGVISIVRTYLTFINHS